MPKVPAYQLTFYSNEICLICAGLRNRPYKACHICISSGLGQVLCGCCCSAKRVDSIISWIDNQCVPDSLVVIIPFTNCDKMISIFMLLEVSDQSAEYIAHGAIIRGRRWHAANHSFRFSIVSVVHDTVELPLKPCILCTRLTRPPQSHCARWCEHHWPAMFSFSTLPVGLQGLEENNHCGCIRSVATKIHGYMSKVVPWDISRADNFGTKWFQPRIQQDIGDQKWRYSYRRKPKSMQEKGGAQDQRGHAIFYVTEKMVSN